MHGGRQLGARASTQGPAARRAGPQTATNSLLPRALPHAQVGKDVEGDRWEQIAALVPGKTKAQCFKRFKELKENFKAKKASAT